MIQGAVNASYEAAVSLRVRGPSGAELDVEAIVDSGFTSSLCLPTATTSTLGLVRAFGGGAILADGSRRKFGIYAAEVMWGGVWRPVLVSALGHEPLLGMRLMAGHVLRIEIEPGGSVDITPLVRRPNRAKPRPPIGKPLKRRTERTQPKTKRK